MAAIDKLLSAAIRAQVESVLLEPGRLPRFRRGGADQEVTQTVLDSRAIERLLAEIAPGHRAPDPALEPRWSFDYTLEGAGFRFVGMATAAGWTVLASPVAAAAPPRAAQPALAAAASDRGPRTLPAIETLLRTAVDLGGSELHLAANEPPVLRLNGELSRLETYEAPTSAHLKELLWEIAPRAARDEFEMHNEALFACDVLDLARFRVRLLRDREGVGAVFRAIAPAPPSAESLGLPEGVRRLAELPGGFVLLAGAASSGRSSTLAALLEAINERRRVAIVTLEQPIEFAHASKLALVRQREIPAHVASFAAGVAAAADADVLALGRLPDAATIDGALDAAEAGRLVFAVADGATAERAIERLLLALPAERRPAAREQLARVLRAAVAQRLSGERDGRRVAAFELLLGTPDVATLLRAGKLFQIPAAIAAGRAAGMIPRES